MASRYFDADTVLPQLVGHGVEQIIFSQNKTRIHVRVRVNTSEVSYMVEYQNDGGETVFHPKDTLIEALQLAEDKQRVR